MLVLMNFNIMCCFIFKITKSILSYIILGLGNFENNQPKQTNKKHKTKSLSRKGWKQYCYLQDLGLVGNYSFSESSISKNLYA